MQTFPLITLSKQKHKNKALLFINKKNCNRQPDKQHNVVKEVQSYPISLSYWMSLYLGNLSAHTRREELERVFRRFGLCELRLKDGYGFVVYNFTPQAEKALKVLQGQRVCGQLLNMTWSNKQPRPIPRNPRGHKSHEQRGRDFSRTKMPSDYQEAMIGHVEPDIVDGGRWGELAETDDGFDSDLYEPYHGYDRRERDESRWVESSGGSALGSCSQDNNISSFRGDKGSKFRQNCFSCGALGHKARDCPIKHSSGRRFVNKTVVDKGTERSKEIRSLKRRGLVKSKRSTSISAHSEDTDSSSKFRARSRPSPRSTSKSPFAKLVDPKSKSRSRSSSPVSKQPLDHVQRVDSKGNNFFSDNPDFGTIGNTISTKKVEDDMDSEAKPRPKPGSVTSLNSISLEEMCVALKRFGVEVSEESEKHKSLEGFFGSARLWPWEAIYYRRVKKGPISVENYARRVSQNKEFGIVDKYVRSSSGWGEIYHKNP